MATRDLLLAAQCNDAYWHGIFGGLYAPHLRTELGRNLVRAETIADIASLSGPDRTQRLIDGAKKEGAVTLYSSAVTDDSNAIAAAFEAGTRWAFVRSLVPVRRSLTIWLDAK